MLEHEQVLKNLKTEWKKKGTEKIKAKKVEKTDQ